MDISQQPRQSPEIAAKKDPDVDLDHIDSLKPGYAAPNQGVTYNEANLKRKLATRHLVRPPQSGYLFIVAGFD